MTSEILLSLISISYRSLHFLLLCIFGYQIVYIVDNAFIFTTFYFIQRVVVKRDTMIQSQISLILEQRIWFVWEQSQAGMLQYSRRITKPRRQQVLFVFNDIFIKPEIFIMYFDPVSCSSSHTCCHFSVHPTSSFPFCFVFILFLFSLYQIQCVFSNYS